MDEIWVTGAGIVTCLGSGRSIHGEALRSSRSGLGRHELFGGAEPDPCVCGMVPAGVLALSIEESASSRADRLLDIALSAALSDAGLGDGAEADIVAGTTLGNMHGGTCYYRQLRDGKDADPGLIAHFLACSSVEHAARSHGICGSRQTVCSACASASAALGRAYRMIRSGRSRRVIAGGFDALSPFVVAGFNSLRLISSSPCRPFDRDRDGLNPGEGAAMLVLESRECARKRGASPLAAVKGFGEALEAYHYTRADPEGSGVSAALHNAMAGAGMSAGDIGHVHAHGTGTAANDRSEYMACRRVFGDRLRSIPVCSTKPLTGHTFGASGAVNAVFCIESTRQGVVPATRNFENIDHEFEDLRIAPHPLHVPSLATVASCSLGFGGEASVVLFGKAGA